MAKNLKDIFPHIMCIEYRLHYTDKLWMEMVALFDSRKKTQEEVNAIIQSEASDPDVIIMEAEKWSQIKELLKGDFADAN